MDTNDVAVTDENQLEAVRAALKDMSKAEWSAIQARAQISERTLYNIMHKDRKPGYDTVYKVYTAIRAHQQAARA